MIVTFAQTSLASPHASRTPLLPLIDQHGLANALQLFVFTDTW
jgi:hypothetical protein